MIMENAIPFFACDEMYFIKISAIQICHIVEMS